MPNRILFTGGRLDSVQPVSGVTTEVTTGGFFDATYADCVLKAAVSTGAIECPFYDSTPARVSVAAATIWFHCEGYLSGTIVGTLTSLIEVRDSAGFPWIALRVTANATYGMHYNTGTGAAPVWTLIGSTASFAAGKSEYDLTVDIGAGSSHTFTLYRDRVILSGPHTVTMAGFTNAYAIRSTQNGGNTWHLSQLLATEGIPTIGAKVKTARGTGAGTNTGWGGTLTNVNEAINSDATIDSTVTAGVTQTYAMTDVTVPAGYSIRSVWNWLRANNNGTTPVNVKSVLRVGGANYASANLSGIGLGIVPLPMHYDTDPATAVAWTQAGWNAAEAGYQSAA